MKINRIFATALVLFATLTYAQDLKKIEKEKAKLQLFEEEKLADSFNDLYKKNVGKVVFASSEISRSNSAPNGKNVNASCLKFLK